MLVYIKPLSTFPKLHSDTLFGAITYAISELYPDKVDEMIKEFESGMPPFLLSSTFPVIYVNDSKIKFYPKIISNSDLTEFDSKILKLKLPKLQMLRTIKMMLNERLQELP